jgi:hypothetical protein
MNDLSAALSLEPFKLLDYTGGDAFVITPIGSDSSPTRHDTEGILNAAIELRTIRVRAPLLYRRVPDGAPREAGFPFENDTELVKRKGEDHGSF